MKKQPSLQSETVQNKKTFYKKLLPSLIFILVLLGKVNGQFFQNLDFQQKCDSSKTGLCYWNLSWGDNKSVYPDFVDDKNTIAFSGQNEKSVSFAEQELELIEKPEVKIITISSLIKSDGIEGKGAGLNIGIYDVNGTLIANKDMGGFYSVSWINRISNWKKCAISIVCPKGAKKIKIGMILYGKGKVWFSDVNIKTTPIHSRKPSKLALQYVSSACDIIVKNSLVRDSINIQSLKEMALKIAGPAKKYADCFLAVNFLLESLRPFGDHHSFLMSVDEVKNWENEGSSVSKIVFPTYRIIDDCGYILIPPFHGGNSKQIRAYADTLQKVIHRFSHSAIKGWIIDLRQNTGGNMEPMIAGLGPLFTSDKLGSLFDVNGKPNSWFYKNGNYYGDGYKGWTVSNPTKLTCFLPIAVLISNQTGSSGEAVAISFIGNLNTKLFGQPTWGLTTGNGSFELKDGSQIFLASTIMADRTGNRYTKRINPDFLLEDEKNTDTDEVINAAIKWIFNTN